MNERRRPQRGRPNVIEIVVRVPADKVDAVIRNLEIVGEAAKRVPQYITEHHPEIPWSRMNEMRNILVHEYHSVDPSIIYDTARHDLPPLAGPLRALLQAEGG